MSNILQLKPKSLIALMIVFLYCLDETEIYHIGASIKDLGKKWFAFSKLEQNSVLEIFKQLNLKAYKSQNL